MPEHTPSASSRFFALPSTALGRASAALFLVAVVLTALSSTVMNAVSLTFGKVNVVGMVNAIVLFSALVTGVVALIKDHERSWAVWLATVLPAIVLGFVVFEIVTGNWG